MSLIRSMIRLCAVAALRENTWAEDRVMDSDSAPLIDALITGERHKPYIVVFTDTDNMTDVTDGLYSATRNLQLVLEMGIANAVTVEVKQQDGTVSNVKQLEFPYTDPSLELLLDILESQALSAIHGDPRSEWGEIIRDAVTRILRMNSPRGGRTEKGVRFAARSVSLILDTVADPAPGIVLDPLHPVSRFFSLARLRQPEDISNQALLLEATTTSIAYPSWQQAQAQLGLTRRGIRGIGLAPLTDLAPGATPYAKETGEPITDDVGEPPMSTEITTEDTEAPHDIGVVVDPLQPNDPNFPEQEEELLPLWPVTPYPKG